MLFKTKLRSTNFLIDLTPLVDVSFLMLIFFLITSDILPLKSLNIENPTLNRNSSPLTTQLLVIMDAQNVIYVGSKKDIVDLSSLRDHLVEEISTIKTFHQGVDPIFFQHVFEFIRPLGDFAATRGYTDEYAMGLLQVQSQYAARQGSALHDNCIFFFFLQSTKSVRGLRSCNGLRSSG